MGELIKDKKKVFVELLLSVLCAWFAVFASGGIMDNAVNVDGASSATAELVICSLAVLAGFVLLFYFKGKPNELSLSGAFARTLIVLLFFIIFTLLMSVCNGLIAVYVNGRLQDTASLEKIKQIINFAASIIMGLSFPFIVSVFWTEATAERTVLEDIKGGLKMSWKKYFKLLLMLLMIFGLGYVVTAVYENSTYSVIAGAGTTGVLAVVGLVGLIVSEYFCIPEQVAEKD